MLEFIDGFPQGFWRGMTLGAIGVMLSIVLYEAVAWLRRHRKRPALEPQGAREIAMVEQAWRQGWNAAQQNPRKFLYDISSEAIETTAEIPPGNGGSPRS